MANMENKPTLTIKLKKVDFESEAFKESRRQVERRRAELEQAKKIDWDKMSHRFNI